MISGTVGKPARVIGDSACTGKTFARNGYRLKYAPNQPNGDAPIKVIYWARDDRLVSENYL